MVKYSEIIQLDAASRERVINGLSERDIADLVDQQPFYAELFVQDINHVYFDSIEDFYNYILHNVVPSTKPWRAEEIAGHEYGHATCALAMGASGIKYSVSVKGELGSHAFAHFQTPTQLPNLAFAAIAMHPFGSDTSNVDMRAIQEGGYASREHVTERIKRWNNQNNDFYIPEPQAKPISFQRSK